MREVHHGRPSKERIAARAKKHHSSQEGQLVAADPGNGGMVPQVTNSSVGGVRLGRMVGTAAMKTTGSRRVSPRKAP